MFSLNLLLNIPSFYDKYQFSKVIIIISCCAIEIISFNFIYNIKDSEQRKY